MDRVGVAGQFQHLNERIAKVEHALMSGPISTHSSSGGLMALNQVYTRQLSLPKDTITNQIDGLIG
jgi:hypothetical protein